MLEIIVSSICMLGNGLACNRGAEAYYKQQKIDVYVKNFENKNKELSTFFVGVGTVYNRKLITKLHKNVILQLGDKESQLIYRFEF